MILTIDPTTAEYFFNGSSSALGSFFQNIYNFIAGFFSRFSFEDNTLFVILFSILSVSLVIFLGYKIYNNLTN